MSVLDSMRVPFLDLRAQFAGIQDEISAAIDAVLSSGQFVGGRYVAQFEEEFAKYTGARFTIGVSSGTAALELALKAEAIGPGDEVIVPANTFFATAEAVSNVGAKPVFADVNPTVFHLDISAVEAVLTPRTRAIIPVHLFGRAMDLSEIELLANERNLVLIEDAAQAHGAESGGRKVGASGRLTCFSCYPGKNLGAYGDAGMITTNDEDLAKRLRLLRDHGSPAKYQHTIIGTNSRLDALQAAVLSVKLRYLDQWNAKRREHAQSYQRLLKHSTIFLPQVPAGSEHVFHLFVIRVSARDQVRQSLANAGIETGIHYPVPLHLTRAYQDFTYPGRGTFPTAETLADEILSLPMFPELTEQQISRVAEVLLRSTENVDPVAPGVEYRKGSAKTASAYAD